MDKGDVTGDELKDVIEENEEKETSLEDDIAATLDAATEDDTDDKQEVKTDDKQEDDTDDKQEDDTDDKQEAKTDDKQEDDTDDKQEKDAGAVTAPEHWSQADKDDFDKLPKEAKPLFMDRVKSLEAGYNTKFQEVARERKALGELNDLNEFFAPHQAELHRQGTSAAAYVKQLVTVAQDIRQNPVEGIRNLARSYGVLDQLALTDSGEGAPWVDPQAKAHIEQLEGKLNELSTHVTNGQRAVVTAGERTAQATVDAFAAAKDDAGSLLNPHFAEVEKGMVAVIQAAPGTTLEQAYEQAVWANPTTRKAMLVAQSTAETVTREKVRKEEVAKAKKASKQTRSRSASARQSTGNSASKGTVRDDVAEAFDNLSS